MEERVQNLDKQKYQLELRASELQDNKKSEERKSLNSIRSSNAGQTGVKADLKKSQMAHKQALKEIEKL